MKHIKLYEQFVNESTLYKKGDKLTIDMGDGPEQVTVLSDFSAGASKTQFITLKRPKGAPYTITLGRLNKVLVNESKAKEFNLESQNEAAINSDYKRVYKVLTKKFPDLVDTKNKNSHNWNLIKSFVDDQIDNIEITDSKDIISKFEEYRKNKFRGVIGKMVGRKD
jgi:hypothetical protein